MKKIDQVLTDKRLRRKNLFLEIAVVMAHMLSSILLLLLLNTSDFTNTLWITVVSVVMYVCIFVNTPKIQEFLSKKWEEYIELKEENMKKCACENAEKTYNIDLGDGHFDDPIRRKRLDQYKEELYNEMRQKVTLNDVFQIVHELPPLIANKAVTEMRRNIYCFALLIYIMLVWWLGIDDLLKNANSWTMILISFIAVSQLLGFFAYAFFSIYNLTAQRSEIVQKEKSITETEKYKIFQRVREISDELWCQYYGLCEGCKWYEPRGVLEDGIAQEYCTFKSEKLTLVDLQETDHECFERK